MNIILMTVVAGALALAAQGAVNDMLLAVSTPGPDRYADGKTVLDGECYALVWTKTGASFAGFSADGASVGSDSRVVLFAPLAKDGKCPEVIFQLDGEAFRDGSFGVYLLDTRLANGKVGGVRADGRPVAVNGYSATSARVRNVQSTAEMLPTAATGGALVSSERSALPVNAPQPQITAIDVVGDKVFLKVKGTLACLQYGAKRIDSVPGAQAPQTVQDFSQGASAESEEITIVMPKNGDSGLYQVNIR